MLGFNVACNTMLNVNHAGPGQQDSLVAQETLGARLENATQIRRELQNRSLGTACGSLNLEAFYTHTLATA